MEQRRDGSRQGKGTKTVATEIMEHRVNKREKRNKNYTLNLDRERKNIRQAVRSVLQLVSVFGSGILSLQPRPCVPRASCWMGRAKPTEWRLPFLPCPWSPSLGEEASPLLLPLPVLAAFLAAFFAALAAACCRHTQQDAGSVKTLLLVHSISVQHGLVKTDCKRGTECVCTEPLGGTAKASVHIFSFAVETDESMGWRGDRANAPRTNHTSHDVARGPPRKTLNQTACLFFPPQKKRPGQTRQRSCMRTLVGGDVGLGRGRTGPGEGRP